MARNVEPFMPPWARKGARLSCEAVGPPPGGMAVPLPPPGRRANSSGKAPGVRGTPVQNL